jgi:CDP-glucose 4,6-dehydratase
VIDPGFWRRRRVLLTGHTGFKGAWLALWLYRLGAHVTGFGQPAPAGSLFALARVGEVLHDAVGEIRNEAAVRAVVAAARPDVVFHLAAQPLVRAGLRDPVGTYAINVLGTAHVLAAVGATAPVVCVTSDKCYAPHPEGAPRREDDRLGGRDPYSASKAAQELIAAAARETGGVRVATARAGNAIGGGDRAPDRLVPDLVRAAEAGAPAVLRNPGAVRPWQHVLNPLAGYLLLAQRLAASAEFAEAWNFGPATADERPVRWIAERWPEPVEIVEADERDAEETPVLRLDSAKARTRLGWAPAWDLPAALDATAGWHRAVRNGEDARRVTLEQIERYERAAEQPG